MKRRDILVSLAIIAAALLACYFVFRQEGAIVIETPGTELRLDRPFFGGTTLKSSQDPVTMPARAYRPRQLAIATQAAGDTWKLTSSGPWGGLASIRVAPGRTTSLQVGPPLQILPKVSAGSGRAYVELQIFGCAGERYSNVIEKNGARILAPRLKIVDEEGTVLVDDRFQYG